MERTKWNTEKLVLVNKHVFYFCTFELHLFELLLNL